MKILRIVLFTLFAFSLPSLAQTDLTKTEIYQAVIANDAVKVQNLIDQGVDVNETNAIGRSILYYAIKYHKVDAANVLIKNTADLNHQDYYGETPLMYATSEGFEDITQTLLQTGVRINLLNKHKDSAFLKLAYSHYYGLEVKHALIARMLLDHGQNIEERFAYGDTALMLTAQQDNVPMGDFLIKSGASLDAKGPKSLKSRTALMYALGALHYSYYHGSEKIAKLLIESGADVNAKDDDGNTALYFARRNYPSLVQLLIEHGAKNLDFSHM